MSEDIGIGMLNDAMPEADRLEFRIGPRRVYNLQPVRHDLAATK